MKRKFGKPGPSPGETTTVRDVHSPGGRHSYLQRFQPALNCFQTEAPSGATVSGLNLIRVDNQAAVRNARAKVTRDLRSDVDKAAALGARRASRDARTDEDKATALHARKASRDLHLEDIKSAEKFARDLRTPEDVEADSLRDFK